jgi:hypothetical protein
MIDVAEKEGREEVSLHILRNYVIVVNRISL